MSRQSRSAIVLRKVAGRLIACRQTSRTIHGAVTIGRAPSLVGALAAFAMVLLLPLAALAAVALLVSGHHALAGVALATTPVGSPAEIRDQILRVFEEFKASNDERLAALETRGAADPLVTEKVEKLNDRISELSAAVNRQQFAPRDAEPSEADRALAAKMRAFFTPSEEDRDRKATLTLSFPSAREREAQRIQAAQAVGTSGAGGAIVAPAFSNRLEKALLFFSGMMQVSETIDTETGADLAWPTVNDTTQAGAILTENSTVPAQDVTFSSLTFKAYMYTSKLIAVSWQILQDAAFGVDGMVADLAGERLGRILNTHLTTGSGASQPNGVVTAASSGKTGTAGQTTSVIYDDLVDLVHSVDVAYRAGSKFMLADSSLKAVRKLRDSQGRPLWEPSLQAGVPDSILGYPVVVNNDVAAMQANAKSILFGDFTKYKVRRVKEITLVRLNERYADNLQTGFFAYARFDGNLVNAGTNPIKYYANSAT